MEELAELNPTPNPASSPLLQGTWDVCARCQRALPPPHPPHQPALAHCYCALWSYLPLLPLA